MILSIWRYSHLALALASLVFVLILSVTGFILAFEPVNHAARNVKPVSGFAELTLAETVAELNAKYSEITRLDVDADGFVSVSVITETGDLQSFYIDPATGSFAAELPVQSQFMKDVTSLHRSLFLKSTGRFFVGLSSFLLFLIVVSGSMLIIKRQQGVKKFFRKIIRDNFSQYAHVYLGRIALLPLLLITLSGVYLSLLRFSLIPDPAPSVEVEYETIRSEPVISPAAFPIFQNTSLSEVRSVEFPFSKDPIDFYTLSLRGAEVCVNQYTGEILGRTPYPLISACNAFALFIHTGRGSPLWAGVLGLSALAVLFFTYTGFRMTLRRRSARIRNSFRKSACTHYVLVGSESGTTLQFARAFQRHLKAAGVKAFVMQMNDFTPAASLEHIVVLTATYGRGEPPANARKFQARLAEARFDHPFNYAVVGFGSRAYPDFCKFAFETDQALATHPKSTRLMEPFSINSRSEEAWRQWLHEWNRRAGLPRAKAADSTVFPPKTKPKKQFRIASHQSLAGTSLIVLTPTQKIKITSGDLLGICPPGDPRERLYSAGVTSSGSVILSVRRHEMGACSTWLCSLSAGDFLRARIVKNKTFRMPKNSGSAVMIATGTGIAPFLGMADQTGNYVPPHLYWGGKTSQSLKLYHPTIDQLLNAKKLTTFKTAFSREPGSEKYVQDLICRDAAFIAETLRNKGLILICGSIAMQKGVTDTLDQILRQRNDKPLSWYQNKGRIRMDCY